MQNYVISLKTQNDRRNHIVSEFKSKEIEFNFFDALIPKQAIIEAEKMGFIIDQSMITEGEVACFMSHVMIWKKIITENLSHVAIFEDDVVLGRDAYNFLSSSDWIQPNWSIIKLEKFNQRVLLSNLNFKSPSSNIEVKELVSKHYGCAGYIISLSTAKELITYLKKNPLLIPLDHIVFEKFMPISTGLIVQVNPAICIQNSVLTSTHDNFPSSLEVQRRKRMRKYKKKFLNKFINEISRIISQIKLKILGENLNFD